MGPLPEQVSFPATVRVVSVNDGSLSGRHSRLRWGLRPARRHRSTEWTEWLIHPDRVISLGEVAGRHSPGMWIWDILLSASHSSRKESSAPYCNGGNGIGTIWRPSPLPSSATPYAS